jgi:hypothetical protein
MRLLTKTKFTHKDTKIGPSIEDNFNGFRLFVFQYPAVGTTMIDASVALAMEQAI